LKDNKNKRLGRIIKDNKTILSKEDIKLVYECRKKIIPNFRKKLLNFNPLLNK